jgi:hypothetical protein
MTENRTARQKAQHSGNAGKEKKLYQKPAFRHEQVFETQALSCGKISATSSNCRLSRKTS